MRKRVVVGGVIFALLAFAVLRHYSLSLRVNELGMMLQESAQAREVLEEEVRRLRGVRQRLLSDLEEKRAHVVSRESSPDAVPKSSGASAVSDPATQSEQSPQPTLSGRERADIFLAGIERITALTENEREALRESFLRGEEIGSTDVSLETILGAERADFIREQRRAAFTHSELEEIEKNAFYFSKKLALDDEQEGKVLNALTDIQSELEFRRKTRSAQKMSPRERMQQLIEDAQLYRKRLLSSMQNILRPSQLEQYLEYDEKSSAASMELWHAPSEE